MSWYLDNLKYIWSQLRPNLRKDYSLIKYPVYKFDRFWGILYFISDLFWYLFLFYLVFLTSFGITSGFIIGVANNLYP